MVIGKSRCGVSTAAANADPVATDDTYTATSGRALVVSAAGDIPLPVPQAVYRAFFA